MGIRTTTVRLGDVLARHDDMIKTLASGRVSDTPEEPIFLCGREDMPDRFELCDGHHRVAAMLRAGANADTEVIADICPGFDEEPLEPPFYDFDEVVAPWVPSTR